MAPGFANIVFVHVHIMHFFFFFFNSRTVSSLTLARASVTGGPGVSSDGPFGGLRGLHVLLRLTYD